MTGLSLNIPLLVCQVLAFVPAIVLHEVGHGFAAYKLGDPTAKSQGRLSLNPLSHVDPFGTVIMPLLLMLMSMPVFGYAKPVPYNPRYFKNPRRDDFIVGMAGPLANLLQAMLGSFLAFFLDLTLGNATGLGAQLVNTMAFQYFYWYFLPLYVMINLYLMFFNLLPVPPLDGSSIIALLIPRRHLGTYYRIQQYALPVFMLLVIVVPYVLNVNPIGVYLDLTAGSLGNLLYPQELF